jgi:hypothetical protein
VLQEGCGGATGGSRHCRFSGRRSYFNGEVASGFSDDRQSGMASVGMRGAGRRCCISYPAPPLTGSPAGFSGNAGDNFSGNGCGSREERGGRSEELGGSAMC